MPDTLICFIMSVEENRKRKKSDGDEADDEAELLVNKQQKLASPSSVHNDTFVVDDRSESPESASSGRKSTRGIRFRSLEGPYGGGPQSQARGSAASTSDVVSSSTDTDGDTDWSVVKERRRRRRRQPSQLPTPEIAEYPVVLEDVGKAGDTRYKDFGQFTAGLFREAGIAPIRRQRRLAAGRWLIHCQTRAAQQALAKKTKLGGVKVKCYIPSPKTVGVVRPIPRNVDMQTIVGEHPKLIASATRLNLRSGEPSQAVKIVFNTNLLPDVLQLGNELVGVTPFTEAVLRCTKCQRLGHKKSKCPAKSPVCARCGKAAHDPDPEKNRTLCPANQDARYCVNCKTSGHSAAWRGCPRLKLHQKASTESARLGIPVGVILSRLAKEGADSHDNHSRDHSFYYNKAPSHPPSSKTGGKAATYYPGARSFSSVMKGDGGIELQLQFPSSQQRQGDHPAVSGAGESQSSDAPTHPVTTPRSRAERPSAHDGERQPLRPRRGDGHVSTSRSESHGSGATAAVKSAGKDLCLSDENMACIKSWMSNFKDHFTEAMAKYSEQIDKKLNMFDEKLKQLEQKLSGSAACSTEMLSPVELSQ